MVAFMADRDTVEACDHSCKRPALSYDHLCETPFELQLKLCNEKLP